jgi:SAM-dependent methyltransferase
MSPLSIPIQGFDEETYLQANPDVRAAIASGIITSGLVHYRRFGRDECRPGGPDESRRPSYSPLAAMPPDALRKRVHGDTDLASFDRHGRSICGDLLDAIAGFRIPLGADSRVLDFGCGCGRVFRHLVPQCDAQVEGSDIDAEAIAWSNSNLKDGAFRQNPEMPPLPFEDGRFDLIYSISVFTHLPEDMQLAWLAELARVAKPGAFLLLTVHGPDLLPAGDTDAARRIADHGFCYLRLEATEGLPDFYRTAYHAEHYIRREWARLMQIEGVLRREIGGHQDLVVARLPR